MSERASLPRDETTTAMPKADTVEIKLLRLKETKGTVVYEGAEGDPLRLLYVQKGSFSPMPDALRVTLEAVRPPTVSGARD